MNRAFSSLGVFGVVLYWAIALFLFMAPFCILGWPWWVDSLVILVMMSIPLIGIVTRLVVYVWAMFCLGGCTTAAVTVFWVSFALYVLFELFPVFMAMRSCRR